MGLAPEDCAEDIELWTENLPAFSLFAKCATQWHRGMNGPTGLRYDVAHRIARWHGVKQRDWLNLFEDLQTMESEVLEMLRGERG